MNKKDNIFIIKLLKCKYKLIAIIIFIYCLLSIDIFGIYIKKNNKRLHYAQWGKKKIYMQENIWHII